MPINLDTLEIAWTWDHCVEGVCVAESDVVVSVLIEPEPDFPAHQWGWSVDSIGIRTGGGRYSPVIQWLPDSDDLVAVIKRDLERDERFRSAVDERIAERAREAA